MFEISFVIKSNQELFSKQIQLQEHILEVRASLFLLNFWIVIADFYMIARHFYKFLINND